MLAVIATKNDGNAVGILDPVLLARPLEFILADHLRQRNLCALLERLAGERRFNPALGASVADYMADELPIHMLDEDEDLFPLLRRRALPGDDVERVLGLLSREHSDADRQLEGIVNGLREAISAGRTELDTSLAMTLRTFAHRKRRHLAVENAIIMPLAEARLTPKDSEGLARRMAVRRRIRLSPGASA
jgi:hypothetical protein